jgi:hypothetical protein
MFNLSGKMLQFSKYPILKPLRSKQYFKPIVNVYTLYLLQNSARLIQNCRLVFVIALKSMTFLKCFYVFNLD